MFPDPADELAERERRNRRTRARRSAPIPFGTDAAAMDAEVMDFEQWRNFYADLETGLRQYERAA